MPTTEDTLQDLFDALAKGELIPYLGPGLLTQVPDCPLPDSQEKLAALLAAQVTVPHKIRNRLTATAQFIENFKHRKSLVQLMQGAFSATVPPLPLQQVLAGMAEIPMIVALWYDDAMRSAMLASGRDDWGQVQGLSQSEHFGTWYQYYDGAGQTVQESIASSWNTLLYQPIGAHAPAANYLVSDSDFVEVLTEIDIQTPIPAHVQGLRHGRHFLFIGCRFNDQLQRSFAHQITKRSSARHWAVLAETPSRNEQRFLEEHGIEVLPMATADFSTLLCAQLGLPV
ncbi:transcriptional regulator [Herbaspirillum rubrisubalbicans]|uniref:Transcriptional regulator n=1 Tax=Herbaspirillum rubrisubalbicans TaxID=80842 RepID=A0ABX9C825_9BURK|nr:SIR2 family protein [Herbaspirillum rubrisubalbicans]RAM67093.1 transcriptional regulator [Herbaspirillum rubrisubalbicans]RAN49042.1 transcriptional regulator [Herbaspirillum rubrisubalbicans]